MVLNFSKAIWSLMCQWPFVGLGTCSWTSLELSVSSGTYLLKTNIGLLQKKLFIKFAKLWIHIYLCQITLHYVTAKQQSTCKPIGCQSICWRRGYYIYLQFIFPLEGNGFLYYYVCIFSLFFQICGSMYDIASQSYPSNSWL